MGVLDEFKAAFGDDLGAPGPATDRRHNWRELCVCGHTDIAHSPDIGGAYRLPSDGEVTFRGETVKVIHLFHGCRGAMPLRGVETETVEMDRATMVRSTVIRPTCPCELMRPVANIDRPNRYFNQRLHADRQHPFTVGIRAYSTFLSRRKYAELDPDWPIRELDRRFQWIPEKRKCSISGCKAQGEGVFPAFVNGDLHSELRCEKHRD